MICLTARFFACPAYGGGGKGGNSTVKSRINYLGRHCCGPVTREGQGRGEETKTGGESNICSILLYVAAAAAAGIGLGRLDSPGMYKYTASRKDRKTGRQEAGTRASRLAGAIWEDMRPVRD